MGSQRSDDPGARFGPRAERLNSIRPGRRIGCWSPTELDRRKQPAPVWCFSSEIRASRKPTPCSVVSMHGNRPVYRPNRRCLLYEMEVANDQRRRFLRRDTYGCPSCSTGPLPTGGAAGPTVEFLGRSDDIIGTGTGPTH